jgi:esterase/lipase superfamily enzyme
MAGCGTSPGRCGVALGRVANTVDVFYVTDRAVESTGPAGAEYGWRRAYSEDSWYDLGMCRVEIRRDRHNEKAGPLPRSTTDLIALLSTTPMERRAFYESLREKVRSAGANETFVFVHGFNNSFEDAVKRTAELWYDLDFPGPPIAYSWPSRGGRLWRGIFGYFCDSESVKWSVIHLKAFLLDLVEETRASRVAGGGPVRIHLIGHSLGSQALARALVQVADELGQAPQPVFCEVVLAAPDIDRDFFRDVVLYKLLRSGLVEHYTLYASSSDSVLRTSAALQVYPRAGNADDGLVPVHHPKFNTVDASAVKSRWLSFNHDYFITEPRVIRDLIQVVCRRNRDPSSSGRAMQRRADEPGSPWVMLPDEEPGASALAGVEPPAAP